MLCFARKPKGGPVRRSSVRRVRESIGNSYGPHIITLMSRDERLLAIGQAVGSGSETETLFIKKTFTEGGYTITRHVSWITDLDLAACLHHLSQVLWEQEPF